MVFTGGGTAGHVLPNIGIIEELRTHYGVGSTERLDVLYVGSFTGPEKRLCEAYDVTFEGISTGKFRRYFSWKNFIDPFRVMKGCLDAWMILRRFRPDVVFSKGGFVSVPVVLAAAKLGVPVVLHEADVTPGLSNRICARFAKVICVSWEKTLGSFPEKKTLFTGMPVRREVTRGARERGLSFLDFDGTKPILLVMGGSLGAQGVNRLVWSVLPKLMKLYDVVHIVGGGSDHDQEKAAQMGHYELKAYRSFPYLQEELFDVYACADVVVSRAGASALAELCVLGKPAVLIPLGSSQSRGDQIVNAELLREAGAAEVYLQETNEPTRFTELVCSLADEKDGTRKRSSLSKNLAPFGARFKRSASQIAEVIMGLQS